MYVCMCVCICVSAYTACRVRHILPVQWYMLSPTCCRRDTSRSEGASSPPPPPHSSFHLSPHPPLSHFHALLSVILSFTPLKLCSAASFIIALTTFYYHPLFLPLSSVSSPSLLLLCDTSCIIKGDHCSLWGYHRSAVSDVHHRCGCLRTHSCCRMCETLEGEVVAYSGLLAWKI